MTQLLKCKCGGSNDLDNIERGIGHRGSSFSDLDAVSHDSPTHRFLVREIKRPGEKLDPGQRILLLDLARQQRWTVWYVMLMHDGQIAWADMRAPESIDVITRDSYRQLVRDWWDGRYRLARPAKATA